MLPPRDQAPNPGRIRDVARSLGEDVGADAVAALVKFGALFLKWNARINLGGTITADELVERHFADAVAAARMLGTGIRVVDVGSGGGLPIIPMALLRTAAEFDLFEPTAKKVAFLRTSVRELGLGERVRIHSSRIEGAVGSDARGRFDVACSRATFPVSEWLRLGRSLVRPGGRVIVFATGRENLELPAAGEEHRYAPDRRILVF